jgi:AAA+ ATPase superfamily predicted ATPase/Holliday junction resolvase
MFRTNTPATDGFFFDREDELETLQETVEALERGQQRWLAILGLRKIGKTSLLLELARRNQSRARNVSLLVSDVTDYGPPSLEFFRRYALEVVDALLGRELGASLKLLALHPSEYRNVLIDADAFRAVPRELRTLIQNLPDIDVSVDVARACLQLPEDLAKALDTRLLVALDEFQELATIATKRGGPDPFPLMRSTWQRHSRVAYVISGSSRTMIEGLVTHRDSPFFQHFTIVELKPFPGATALAMLKELAPDGRTIPSPIAAKIVEITAGHPFYLQILGETLTSQPGPYEMSHLKDALGQTLFSRTGRLALYFQAEFERVVGRASGLAGTLEALSDGPSTVTEVATRLAARSGTAVHYLERVHEVVSRREDGRYALVDPTFADWIRWRKPGGTVVPMTLLGDEAEIAVARFLARLGFELVYQSRASRGAFDLLALKSGMHLGVQVKRAELPLRFRKGEWDRMQHDAKRFGWRFVIAAVSEETVTILDPSKARRAKEVRLTQGATIDNLLEWLSG